MHDAFMKTANRRHSAARPFRGPQAGVQSLIQERDTLLEEVRQLRASVQIFEAVIRRLESRNSWTSASQPHFAPAGMR
jgi:uncharacterized coiled-coil DUF342 family protein